MVDRQGLVALATYECVFLLGGFALAVVWKLLTLSAWPSGLLTGVRADGSNYTSVGRIQLLGVSLTSALYYLVAVLQSPTAIPDLPPALVVSVAVSQSLYLADKALAAWSTYGKP